MKSDQPRSAVVMATFTKSDSSEDSRDEVQAHNVNIRVVLRPSKAVQMGYYIHATATKRSFNKFNLVNLVRPSPGCSEHSIGADLIYRA